MGVDYRPNRAALAAMPREPWVIAAVRERADAIRAEAERLSPVRTGRYRAAWKVRSGIRDGRAWARVSNNTPYAVFLEYGTRRMRKHRVLGRAIENTRI